LVDYYKTDTARVDGGREIGTRERGAFYPEIFSFLPSEGCNDDHDDHDDDMTV
jgi:hypothetical protein